MRLSNFQTTAIKESASTIFGKNTKVMLFGSRVDDTKKGGDIDLLIDSENKDINLSLKFDFLALLYESIGEQKIDVVIKQENDNRLVVREALKKGIEL